MTAATLAALTILLLVPVPVWLAFVEFGLQLLGVEWEASPPQPASLLGADKVVHFLLFFWLALQLRGSALAVGLTSYRPILVFCVLYAVAIEILQGITGRTADAADALADVVGALVFVGWSRFRERRG
ncbi:MAG: VanZ family protein [Acidobacteriota bacterium]